jgi:membrane-bound lytic murein transglycosylase C
MSFAGETVIPANMSTRMITGQDGHQRKVVTNRQNRVFCALAAYNTGMRNMARPFQKDGSIRRSLQMVNRMSPENVYAQLKAFAPSKQTRTYMKKVKERMPLYQ